MITDLKALKIKAEAYDKIRNSFSGTPFSWDELAAYTFHVCKDTDALLGASQFDELGVNERLVQSRMRRLLSTQFVHVRAVDCPKIENEAGKEQWLQRRDHTYEISADADLAYEQLCDLENLLFATEDEMVVFYHGDFLWQVSSYPDQDQLRATCRVYTAHKWDGKWHAEAAHRPVKIELSPTRVDVSNCIR